jgi:hypothetical protein
MTRFVEVAQVLQHEELVDVIFVSGKGVTVPVLPLPSQSAFVVARKALSGADLPVRRAWIQGAGTPCYA